MHVLQIIQMFQMVRFDDEHIVVNTTADGI